MKLRLIAALMAPILLWMPLTVHAKTIFQAGADISIDENQKVDNVVALGGQITVKGLVEQKVVAIGGSVILTSSSVVRGSVIVVGGVVARGSGSLVYGNITEINSSTLSSSIESALRGESEGWSLILDIISLCFFAIILIIALIMTLVLPRPLALIGQVIQTNKAKSFFWGCLTTLMIAPFFMLLVISIIGIFLIPLAFTALILAAIVGFIACGSLVGNFIITRIFHSYKKSLVKETLVGLCVIWLLGWLPFYTGMMIKTLAITWGMGGVWLTLTRRRSVH